MTGAMTGSFPVTRGDQRNSGFNSLTGNHFFPNTS
jgi:hypothetical protein